MGRRALLYVTCGTLVVRLYFDRYMIIARLSTGFELSTTCSVSCSTTLNMASP